MPFDEGDRSFGGGNGGSPHSSEDIAMVSFFLRGCEHDDMWAEGIKAHEAFDAFCRIVNLPADELRSHIDGMHDE